MARYVLDVDYPSEGMFEFSLAGEVPEAAVKEVLGRYETKLHLTERSLASHGNRVALYLEGRALREDVERLRRDMEESLSDEVARSGGRGIIDPDEAMIYPNGREGRPDRAAVMYLIGRTVGSTSDPALRKEFVDKIEEERKSDILPRINAGASDLSSQRNFTL